MSNPHFFTDIGLNLASPQFSADAQAVLARAEAVGVRRVILTGVSLESTAENVVLCEKATSCACYFTAGVHPHRAASLGHADLGRLKRFLQHPRAVAAGEMGLDYFRDIAPRSVQRAAFSAQITLAIEAKKPLFLHERHAHADFLAVLDSFGSDLPRCVVHCFTGDEHEAAGYVERAFYFGITGWVGQRRRNAALLRALPHIPLDRIMLETDAPYLAPDNFVTSVPRRNEPVALPVIAKLVADAKGLPLAALAAAAEENTCRFFGLA